MSNKLIIQYSVCAHSKLPMQLFEHTSDSWSTLVYIESILNVLHAFGGVPFTDIVIVMDDAGFHSSKVLLKSVLDNKGVTLVIMPPNSPSINGAEFINYALKKLLLPKYTWTRETFPEVVQNCLTKMERKWELAALAFAFRGVRMS